jgi:hypothetical protein
MRMVLSVTGSHDPPIFITELNFSCDVTYLRCNYTVSYLVMWLRFIIRYI